LPFAEEAGFTVSLSAGLKSTIGSLAALALKSKEDIQADFISDDEAEVGSLEGRDSDLHEAEEMETYHTNPNKGERSKTKRRRQIDETKTAAKRAQQNDEVETQWRRCP
jgi:hypothetical protein